MKYIIIFCTPIQDRLISNDVISQHDFFKNSSHIFLKNKIVVKYFYDFLNESKKNMYAQKKVNYFVDDDILLKNYNQDCENILEIILENKEYNDSIVIGFESLGFDKFLNNKYFDLLKKKNMTLILSIYDPHVFYNNILMKKLNISRIDLKKDMLKFYNIYQSQIELKDKRLDMADLIISPSIDYFKNIDSLYKDKTYFIPFSFNSENEKIFKIQNFNNFNERINKIILSGSLDFYKIRKIIFHIVDGGNIEFLKNNVVNFENLIEFKKIIYHYKYFKYFRKNLTNNDFDGGIKYCQILSKYKGSFVCFADFPIDFPLLKLIESLLAGCICFVEPKSFLKEKFGLIEFLHYVPILLSNDNKLILDESYYNKYLNSDEGLNIAIEGNKYIIQNFKDDDVAQLYVDILKKKNVII
jgi:hypothetical protein